MRFTYYPLYSPFACFFLFDTKLSHKSDDTTVNFAVEISVSIKIPVKFFRNIGHDIYNTFCRNKRR